MLDKQVNKSDIGVETNFKLRVLQHLPEGAQEILEVDLDMLPSLLSQGQDESHPCTHCSPSALTTLCYISSIN